MNTKPARLVLNLFILSAILFFAGLAILKLALATYYFTFFPFLVLLFFLINSGFLLAFGKSVQHSDQQFIRSYMMYTVIKLLIYVIIIMIYIITTPGSAIPFSVTTGILYLVYTVYDIFVMIRLLNQKR